jgi:photosystem II stability/assembly factor-like uncharacterized protein
MNPKLAIILTVHLLIGFAFPVSAQKWVRMMQDPEVNFYDVQKEFNRYWKEHEKEERHERKRGNTVDEEEEEESYLQYKRWEEYTESRIDPSGKRLDPAFVSTEYQNYIGEHANLNGKMASQANWTIVGPVYQGCAGRINCVRFHPVNSNTVYAGAESGGLWKSTDAGVTWTTNTDNLASLKIRDFAFDPSNTSTMYLTTDIALFKSTDGGNTWNQTTLSGLCAKVIVHPSNSSIVMVQTNNAIYRSTDGAATFSQVCTGVLFKCLKFKADDPNIVFATDYQKFYRSTDGGQTFTVITSGLPSGTTINLQMAVTVADANYVYIVASDVTNSAFAGLYLSVDAGLNFTLKSNSPNIVGSQGWFALAIAVSPTNRDEVVVGGLNIYRSINTGVNWTQISTWNVPNMTGQVHVDIDDLQYSNGTTIYAGTDGGVFSTANSGSTWTNRVSGLQVIQPYGFGISQITPSLVMVGTQDNGTKTYNGVTWTQNIGGDGSGCFIDWSSDTYRYASLPSGGTMRLGRSTDGGATYNYCDAGINETTTRMSIPWMQDHLDSLSLYAGYTNVWRSADRGTTWTKISTFGGGVTAIGLCRASNSIICAATSNPKKVYRTTNSGTTWTDITGTLPLTTINVIDIAVKETDPNKIWVLCNGTSAGNKVFESSDGGITWQNISGTLPNIPFDCIMYDKSSAQNGLYAGADIGVYYHDDALNAWVSFNNNLPNARVTQLKIQYSSGKLRASLYGRGVWESDLYVNTPTGIVSNDDMHSLKVFPNPFSSEVTIQTKKILHNATLIVSNCFGQTVKEMNNINGQTVSLLRDNLANGFYFVRLTEENKIIETAKIVITD